MAGPPAGYGAPMDSGMPVIASLDELADAVRSRNRGSDLYVRWSRGPDHDLPHGPIAHQPSHDPLTGVPLPGLSVSPLRVEQWWGDRPVQFWVARRLCGYRQPRRVDVTDGRPWLLVGDLRGRGPDNEPLVACRRPVAWIDQRVVWESEQALAQANGADWWGPLVLSTVVLAALLCRP